MRARVKRCGHRSAGWECDLPWHHAGACRFAQKVPTEPEPNPDRPGIRWEAMLRCDACPIDAQCRDCRLEQEDCDGEW